MAAPAFIDAAIIVGTTMCTWSVQCDSCSKLLTVACKTDRQAIELALDRASQLGWKIAHDRFIRPRPDLCPDCRKDR